MDVPALKVKFVELDKLRDAEIDTALAPRDIVLTLLFEEDIEEHVTA